MGGPARFHAIREAIPDMSDRMLSERLRELGGRRGRDTVRHSGNTRARGICADRKGRALETAIVAIARWAEEWVPAPAAETGTTKS